MTWTRLPDTFNDSPTLLAVGRSARLLHVEALVYANKHTTDGAIPRGALPRITDSPDLDGDVAELVAAGLWTEVATGWVIDWTDQETAERVNARRAIHAERQARYRERGERHARGDHSMCTASCPAKRTTGNASRDASTNGSRDAAVTVSRPVPSRPLGRDGDGTGAGAPSARAPGARRAPRETPVPDLPMEKQDDGSFLITMPGDWGADT